MIAVAVNEYKFDADEGELASFSVDVYAFHAMSPASSELLHVMKHNDRAACR